MFELGGLLPFIIICFLVGLIGTCILCYSAFADKNERASKIGICAGVGITIAGPCIVLIAFAFTH